MATIGFLTDYGLDDAFVAACHGVIQTIAPGTTVIDITHRVPPQDVRRGAAVLAKVAPYLPGGPVVGVVDPGVGTARLSVAVAAGDLVLIGPDNGLLLPAADAVGGARAAYDLRNESLFHHPVRETFHGRDIFAPVAAHLAAGVPISEVGPPLDVSSLVRLSPPALTVSPGRVLAEVGYVDGFGNVQLAADRTALDEAGLTGAGLSVTAAGNRTRAALGARFGDVATGELVCYPDSDDLVALAVNQGSAAALLNIAAGDLIELTR